MKKLNTAQAELVKAADIWLRNNYIEDKYYPEGSAYKLIEHMKNALTSQPDYAEIVEELAHLKPQDAFTFGRDYKVVSYNDLQKYSLSFLPPNPITRRLIPKWLRAHY